MKKIILAIIIIPVVIVLITIIVPKKSLSHRDMEGLRGNVKCMEQKTYFFDSEQQNFESLIRTDNLAEDEDYHFFCNRHILFIREMGSINHNGCKS